jgi:RNA polymerase sigma-70 factor (sigma-E family)
METTPVRYEEEQQFRDYVAGQSARLRRTAYLLCGDWHASQDLVQETLCRLFVVWPRVSKMDQVHLYARKTLLRTYLGTLRRRRWREDPLHLSPDVVDPASHAGATDDRMAMAAALAAVPPKQRAVLVLRFYEDLSVEDTAAVLRCSAGNVKSQSSRGLAALRRALGQDQITADEGADR